MAVLTLPSALLPALLDVLAQISEVRQSLNEGYLKEKLGSAEQTLFEWYLPRMMYK